MADNYDEMARKELAALLKQRGLVANGKNVEMVARLREDDKAKEDARIAEEEEVERVAARAPQRKPRANLGGRPAPRAAQFFDDVEDDDADALDDGGRRGYGWQEPPQGVAGMTIEQLRRLFVEESRKTVIEISGKIADAAVDRKEAALKMDAADYWKDMTFNSRTDHEYDVLKKAGRELFVLSKMVGDKVLAARLERIHSDLVDRAVTLFIGEKAGWASADATFLPAGSLFKAHEKRIERAMEDSRKRKRDDREIDDRVGRT
jgi:hypothetical protein